MRMVCFIYVLFYSIPTSTTVQAQPRKIYLNPKTAVREKQSKFIDSIRFIPLEIKDGIEVGAYYNINVAEKYLLLVDYANNRLLLYSKDGQFVKKINYNNLGRNFYPTYQEHTNQVIFFGPNKNYELTSKDRIQIKLDWDNPRNRKYFKKYTIDLADTTLSIKTAIASEKDIIQVWHYYDDYFVQGQIVTSPLYKDSLDFEFKLYKNNQLVKSFFPYNPIKEPRFLFSEETIAFNQTETPHIRFITRPYCDTIYKIINDSMYPAYQLVMPLENSLPSSFFTKPFKNKTERDNFYRNNGLMLRQVSNFYETPRFIFFLVRYLSNFESYIYEKQTDVIYKTKNIKSDSSQYNLGLFSEFGMIKKGDRLYKTLRAVDILPFFEQHKNIVVPKELEAFLKSKPPNTTPVIVEYKFKN